MSKMTVVNEYTKKMKEKYNLITPAEFYEFIARIAAFKFKDLEDDTLASKIERILDLILPVYGQKRKVLDVEDVKHYSSDETVNPKKVPDLPLRRIYDENESPLPKNRTAIDILDDDSSEGANSFGAYGDDY